MFILGEQILNGGMENFIGNLPVSMEFTTPTSIGSVNRWRVHSGIYLVNMQDGSDLYQELMIYKLALLCTRFCPWWRTTGCHATITFLLMVKIIKLSTDQLIVREQDLNNSNRSFGYFRLVSEVAQRCGKKQELLSMLLQEQGTNLWIWREFLLWWRAYREKLRLG